MYFRIALEIIVAVFAVIGLYGTIRRIAQSLFGSKNILIAIEFLTQRDAESAEVLIRDALSQYIYFPSGRVIAISTDSLSADPELQRVLSTYGISLYVIQEESGS